MGDCLARIWAACRGGRRQRGSSSMACASSLSAALVPVPPARLEIFSTRRHRNICFFRRRRRIVNRRTASARVHRAAARHAAIRLMAHAADNNRGDIIFQASSYARRVKARRLRVAGRRSILKAWRGGGETQVSARGAIMKSGGVKRAFLAAASRVKRTCRELGE